MADKKISQLTALAAANLAPSTDVLAIVDTSATETKKIVAQDLINGVLNVASAVGIGTASPGQKLEVAGNILVNTSGNPYAEIKTSGSGNNPYLKLTADTNSWTFQGTFSNANDDLLVLYNATTLLDLDKNGNLGLGVTPSAWNSSYRAFQVGGSGVGIWSTSSTGGNLYFSNNVLFDSTGTRKYIANAAAAEYESGSVGHVWKIAPSGTAGNAITFTQAMTLDASNRLLVGTTTVGTTAAGAGFTLFESTQSEIRLQTTSSGTGTGNGLQLALSGVDAYLWNIENGSILFGTNNTERGRFTAGGVFIVGTQPTLYGERINVTNGGVGQNCATFYFNTTDDRGNLILRHARASGATQAAMIAFLDSAGTERGSIKTDGSATAYNTSSDRRLKENIEQADDAGEIIDLIEIVKHDWKDGGHVRYGMIAQELHKVAPEAVSAGDDGEEIESTWGVDYSKLVPMLVKEIQSLRSRVAALEAK